MSKKNYWLGVAEKRRKRNARKELKIRAYEAIIMTLVVLIIILAMGVLYVRSIPRIEEYNRQVCAVYGYQEDCKTPSKE